MIDSQTGPGISVDTARWTDSWGLSFDPFLGLPMSYVPVASAEESIARLSHLIESGQSLGILSGESGIGKTAILGQLTRRLRAPNRRFAQVSNPLDGSHLISALAAALGNPVQRLGVGRGSPAAISWRKSLEDAIRLQGFQQTHLILVVDECRDLMRSNEAADLKRLMDLGSGGRPRITLILATIDEVSIHEQPEFRGALPARLHRLTRSEAERYLSDKLRAAGRIGEAFTPRALTRIHGASGGIPRTLDRLASLSLMAGAIKGLEIITPDVIDGIGREMMPYPT